MKKTNFMLIPLLMGLLLFISSCTSNDALSMSPDDSDQLATITGDVIKLDDNQEDITTEENTTSDLNDFDSLQKELEELSDLEITEI